MIFPKLYFYNVFLKRFRKNRKNYCDLLFLSTLLEQAEQQFFDIIICIYH